MYRIKDSVVRKEKYRHRRVYTESLNYVISPDNKKIIAAYTEWPVSRLH